VLLWNYLRHLPAVAVQQLHRRLTDGNGAETALGADDRTIL